MDADPVNTLIKVRSACSAPGKVLVAGGYAVLQGLPCLTLTTTARFTAVAQTVLDQTTINRLQVHSVQFKKTYDYSVDLNKRPAISFVY